MNKIQYINLTHVNKEMAKEHKKTCNSLHDVYMKDMTFEEVAELLDAGCIFGRVGETTDFVAIDVDRSTININTVFERFKDNHDIAVSYSASNNPLKYHILVNLHRTINKDEYRDAVHEEFEKLKSKLCGKCDYMELDKNADSFYQCFYGTSVENECEYTLENSERLYCWTKKGEKPRIFIEGRKYVERPSLNSADYCHKHNLLTIKEEKRYDIYLPSMTRGKLKLIAEGERYNWVRMTGTKLLMRIIYLNHEFNEGWTKWDFLNTLEWITRTNVVKFPEFEQDFKNLSLWFDNKWDILTCKTYEEQKEILEPYFDSSKRQYKSRKYNPTVMSEIIIEHKFDDSTVLFTDKEELMDICKNVDINYYKFIAYAKACNFEVKFETIVRKVKHDICGMTKEEFDNYCKENNISKQQKYYLKKHYDIQQCKGKHFLFI